jgi:brefeldin A-inhibited guanine nucleotide-exchange protein
MVSGSMNEAEIQNSDKTDEDYWVPVFAGFRDIILSCELEVRTMALKFLFDILEKKELAFSIALWETTSKEILFPIFHTLKESSITDKTAKGKEERAIWISSTLVQGFKRFVELFSKKFSQTRFMLADILEVLQLSILHESEVLQRIGTICLEQLVEQNSTMFLDSDWELIANTACDLFEETAPKFLFFRLEAPSNKEEMEKEYLKWNFLNGAPGPPPVKKEFQKQIPLCISHLMVVQLLQNILEINGNDSAFKRMPSDQLFRMIRCFEKSYLLAEVFNESTDLRKALYTLDYMKQMPNLLKQETASGLAYIWALFKYHKEIGPTFQDISIEARFIP